MTSLIKRNTHEKVGPKVARTNCRVHRLKGKRGGRGEQNSGEGKRNPTGGIAGKKG